MQLSALRKARVDMAQSLAIRVIYNIRYNFYWASLIGRLHFMESYKSLRKLTYFDLIRSIHLIINAPTYTAMYFVRAIVNLAVLPLAVLFSILVETKDKNATPNLPNDNWILRMLYGPKDHRGNRHDRLFWLKNQSNKPELAFFSRCLNRALYDILSILFSPAREIACCYDKIYERPHFPVILDAIVCFPFSLVTLVVAHTISLVFCIGALPFAALTSSSYAFSRMYQASSHDTPQSDLYKPLYEDDSYQHTPLRKGDTPLKDTSGADVATQYSKKRN